MALKDILKEKYGINATVFDEIDSTNTAAKRAAAGGAEQWSVFIAKKQSAGRGRLGRDFYSPDGGLYMSILLRPSFSPENNLLITTAAAAAVHEALKKVFGKVAKIKWVNDILADGKKLCGILAETALLGDRPAYTVLGIGVNLFGDESSVPENLKSIMGFVQKDAVSEAEKADFIGEILENFKKYYVNLSAKPHLGYYKENMLSDISVSVLKGDDCYPAVITGIDDEFHLLAEGAHGSEKLSFGEVRICL